MYIYNLIGMYKIIKYHQSYVNDTNSPTTEHLDSIIHKDIFEAGNDVVEGQIAEVEKEMSRVKRQRNIPVWMRDYYAA